MAVNIFEKYGIKEVANVYFEALENDTRANVYKGDIVLFLDTLKVSTIETTAENVAAQGGWGNPRLISWDYGKEINITLTDALMSLESLRFMMGGAIKEAKADKGIWVRHTIECTLGENGKIKLDEDRFGLKFSPEAHEGHPIKVINLTRGTRTQIKYQNGQVNKIPYNDGAYIRFFNSGLAGIVLSTDDSKKKFNASSSSNGWGYEGDVVRFFWEEYKENKVTENGTDFGAVEVTISPNTFPGTYRVVGDTFMRNTNGKDEPFQFVIEKAKVQSNVTLTLEAEGDPTTFEMTLQVLRADSGDEMMKLVRYGTEPDKEGEENDWGSLSTNSADVSYSTLDEDTNPDTTTDEENT